MKRFRQTLRNHRVIILTVLAINIFYMTEGTRFVYAYQVYEQKEARLEEISEFLDIPVEKLRPDHEDLFASIKRLFVDELDPVKAAGLKRLQEVLRRHEEQVASNPYLPQIEEVKREHAVYRIEGVIQDLMQLTQPRGGKALPEPAQRAILRNLHHALREDLTLPLPEGLPAKAQAKHAEMQAKLDRLFDSVRPVVAETQGEMKGTLAQKIAKLSALQEVETRRPTRPPRFADRPLPLRRVEKKVRSEEVSADGAKPSRQVPTKAAPSAPPVEVVRKDGIAPELIELAESLGNAPARILAYVYDNIDYDPKWGAAKPPLGTLWEKSGTSWEQAWLLRDLLTAAGVDARFEWGEIEVPTELITNLTGLDDPWRAGDLLTTAGVPIVLLTQGGEVIGARMSHVWVNAWVDFIPNRGATPGPGDYWIQMGPSLKRFEIAEGIRIHHEVPFSLGGYLRSGTAFSPRRVYEDALWSHLRSNNIDCVALEQLKPKKSVIAEDFPFLPGTLRGKILRIDGEQSQVPSAYRHQVALQVRDRGGQVLLDWSATAAEVYGHRVEIAWPGATVDDQATLDAYGGVFLTPPYLAELKPSLRVDGVEKAAGSAIGSAEDIEIFATLTPPEGSPTVVAFQGAAGERNVLAIDHGYLPQQIIDGRMGSLNAAVAAGDEAQEEAETLALIGAQYLRNLSRDLADLSGWKWQRLTKLGTVGMALQTGKVTTTAGGAPITFDKDGLVIDIATMPLGVFAADAADGFLVETFELLGAQSSYLEGKIFDQVVADEGISAAAFLTRAVRTGQTLTRVDSSNVETALAVAELPIDVEDEVRTGVQHGKIAWISQTQLSVNRWRGAGYIIEDPATGAAGYLATGGYAAGAQTGKDMKHRLTTLGIESWLGATGGLFDWFFEFLGAPNGDLSSLYGDPVNLANGNLWREEEDLFIMARGIPIKWARSYNSQSEHNGALGYGWTFSYGESVEELEGGSLMFREYDGTEHIFELQIGGNYQRPPGKHLSIRRLEPGFELAMIDGSVKTFAADGKLLSISDRHGNHIELHYSPQGLIDFLTDASGRQVLDISWTSGKIIQIKDLIDRTVSYSYDGDYLTEMVDAEGEIWAYRYDSTGNLISLINPLLQTESFLYDSLDRLASHVDPLGHTESFSYDSEGLQAVIQNKRGYHSYVEMDDRGRPSRGSDALGNVTSVHWDADNNWTSKLDPRGGLAQRTFDENGNIMTTTDVLGNTEAFTYEPRFNQLATYSDVSDNTINYTYDQDGNLSAVSRMVSGELLIDTVVLNDHGQMVEAVDAKGQSFTLTYGNNGVIETRQDALGQISTFSTSPLGTLEAFEDPEGNRITANHDNRLRMKDVMDWHGNTTSFTYDRMGRPLEVDGASSSRAWEYDARGQRTKFIDQAGNVLLSEYDAEGNVSAEIDARGNRTTYSYDALGRRQATVDPGGYVWLFGYCNEIGTMATCSGGGSCKTPVADGNFCELTDPLGSVFRRNFDERGFVTEVIDPDGHITKYSYDDLGRQISIIDALGREILFEYDEDDNLTAVIEPNGGRTEYYYDRAGNQTAMKDAEGRLWTSTTDQLNRLKTTTDPLGNTTTYHYDALGNLIERDNADGRRVQYQYDVDRLIAVLGGGVDLASFGYDSFGRRITASNGDVSLNYDYDNFGRIKKIVNDTLEKELGYRYDADGNLTALIRPEGEVEYLYNSRNQLVDLRDPVIGTYHFEYDTLGRRSALHYPNGYVTKFSYDRLNNLKGIVTFDRSSNVVQGYAYSYNDVQRVVERVDLRDNRIDKYEYDNLDRLIRWETEDDIFEEFSYDLVGNRLMRMRQDSVTSYSYDDGNRLTGCSEDFFNGPTVDSSFSWDANGNVVRRTTGAEVMNYSYDPLDRLVEVNSARGIVSMGYGPHGERVRINDSGVETLFLVDPIGSGRLPYVLGEYDSSGRSKRYYSFGPEIDEPLGSFSEDTSSYYHRDGSGSITAISSEVGEVVADFSYLPFGGFEEDPDLSPRFGFTGRELDSDGLMFYRARYYEPDFGRFLSRDVWDGAQEAPASIHGYTYVQNDPVNLIDPSGHIGVRQVAGLLFFSLGLWGMTWFCRAIWPDLRPWFGIGAQTVHASSLSWIADTAMGLLGLGTMFIIGYFTYINFIIAAHLMFKSRIGRNVPYSWKSFRKVTRRFGAIQYYEYAAGFAACGGLIWTVLDKKVSSGQFFETITGAVPVCLGIYALFRS